MIDKEFKPLTNNDYLNFLFHRLPALSILFDVELFAVLLNQ